MASAMVLIALSMTTHSAYIADLLPGFILIGIGGGITGVSSTIVATSNVPTEDQGTSAAVINTAQTLGSSLALAVLVTIAASEAKHLASIGKMAHAASVGGYQLGLFVSAGIASAGLILALLVIPTRRGNSPNVELLEIVTSEITTM